MTLDAVAVGVYPRDMRELRIMLVALFVALPLAAAAQTPQWVVRDLEGGLVGPVLSQGSGQTGPYKLINDSPLWVARRIPGKWLRLRVTENAVWATKNQFPFLYETSDCTGPALLEAPRKKNQVLATVVFDTDVYWPAGPGETRVIRSQGILVGNAAQCQDALVESALCCSALVDGETRFVAEVSGVALADLHLRPPFRLERVVGSSK